MGNHGSQFLFMSKSQSLLFSLLLTGSVALPALAAEHYWFGGKEVTPEFYAGVQMMNEAVALLHSNNNQEAVDKLQQAERLAPDLAELHSDLGLALAKVGRTSEGIQELQTAVKLKPELDVAWMTLGGLYQSMGDLSSAVQVFHEFLNRFPKNPQAPKISALTRGLEGELQKQKANASIAAVNPAPGSGQAAATTANANLAPDYYAEVIKQGRHRWPDKRFPLRVYIASGTGLNGYNPDMEGILRQAFIDWSTASNGKVRFAFVDNPKLADIECSFTDNPHAVSNQGEAGEANVIFDASGISHGYIKILTVPLTLDFPLSNNRLRFNCLHEVGHALGLLGHTTYPEDVMFYASRIQDDYKTLSSRDANTLLRLYSQ